MWSWFKRALFGWVIRRDVYQSNRKVWNAVISLPPPDRGAWTPDDHWLFPPFGEA